MSNNANHTQGDGNIFAELGLSDAEEELAKSNLSREIYLLITDAEYSEGELADLLHIGRSEAALLLSASDYASTVTQLTQYHDLLRLAVTKSLTSVAG